MEILLESDASSQTQRWKIIQTTPTRVELARSEERFEQLADCSASLHDFLRLARRGEVPALAGLILPQTPLRQVDEEGAPLSASGQTAGSFFPDLFAE